MQKSLISAAIGLSLGCLLLGIALCVFSLASPGWMRAAFLEGTPLPPPTVIVVVPPDEAPVALLPTPVDRPPDPTLEPLPTAEGAACGGPERMTIALLGVDDRSHGYERATRTDAITLVTVRFVARDAAMLSLPRDLYVPLPNLESVGIYQDRLNTAFLYGELYGVPGGGPAELKNTVRWNFGVPVDRYVMVNFGAFISVVDAMGGIEVDVPGAIYDPKYPTEDGGVMLFKLAAGRQHMDGETALRYARTRHQDDDYHRIQRQQLVLLAIRDRLFSPEIIPQAPALLGTLSNLGRTDLTAEEIASLLCLGPQIDRAAIRALVIDGTMINPWTTPTGGSVSIPDREAIAPVVDAFLNK